MKTTGTVLGDLKLYTEVVNQNIKLLQQCLSDDKTVIKNNTEVVLVIENEYNSLISLGKDLLNVVSNKTGLVQFSNVNMPVVHDMVDSFVKHVQKFLEEDALRMEAVTTFFETTIRKKVPHAAPAAATAVEGGRVTL